MHARARSADAEEEVATTETATAGDLVTGPPKTGGTTGGEATREALVAEGLFSKQRFIFPTLKSIARVEEWD